MTESDTQSPQDPPRGADRPGLTYDEVDLVLRRATELDHGQGHQAGEGRISPGELEKLGQEIGLSPAAVRTALVELRTRTLAEADSTSRSVDKWFGPARVALQRTVPGSLADVRAEVDAFMQRQSFRVKRNFGERVVWAPATGFFNTMRRALDFTKEARLSTECEIETSITAGITAPSEVDVRFVIDMHRTRNQGAGWSIAVATGLTGIGALVGLFALDAALLLAPAAGGAMVGGLGVLGTRHAYRRELERQHDILARFLDYLEHERGHRHR